MKRIFGPKKDEVTGAWRKLYYDELHNLYFSQDIITAIESWRMRRARHGKRPLGRPRWLTLKWIFKEVGKEGVNWNLLAQDKDQWRSFVNTVMTFGFI